MVRLHSFQFAQLVFLCVLIHAAVLIKCQTSCPQTVINNLINCSDFAVSRGQLGLKGVQLVDQYSNKVQLRGVSSNGLQYSPECVTQSSLSYMVGTWGINVYRAAVYVSEWDNGYVINAAYYDEFIVNIVQWCKELGIMLCACGCVCTACVCVCLCMCLCFLLCAPMSTRLISHISHLSLIFNSFTLHCPLPFPTVRNLRHH